jgi:hypothetical protein
VHINAVIPTVLVSSTLKLLILYFMFVDDLSLSSARDIDPPPRRIV